MENLSDVAATGTWSDSLYLSEDATWDITDRPLGRAGFTGTLLAGESYTLHLDTLMPAAAPGHYRVIVRTDIYNQVYEGVNEVNNRTASGATMEVTVDELVIGAPLVTQLKAGQETLYKITVPQDQTLRVTLSASDDKSANEIFLRHDQVPTSAAFDATYSGPLSSDLTALVPSTEPGTYYLLVRNYSAPAGGADITLLAELLPLVITDVHTDTGGDSKHVTTTIRGAQFHEDAIVKLVRPGIAEYEPLVWEVVDSSKIIATFDFTDAPHGLYDLKVINPDGSEAILPYRFLVERAIEPEVTIGIGGPRVILAGDQATYSIALQGISNLDTPYTYFEVGVPQLLFNPIVYGLPYLEFYTNVRGEPEGAAGTANEDIPWVNMESINNTIGQLYTSGFLYDQPADGFSGFSINLTTYPGLKEMHEKAFAAFRSKMAQFFPELDGLLDNGETGLGDWWEAVKAKADEIQPGLGAAMGQLDFLDMYQSNEAVPDKCVIPFIPFRFHIYATATSMTRAEYVEFQSQQIRDLRTAILDADDAPAALIALAADEQTFVDLYLAALEDADLLRPDGETPPIRTQQHIVSLMTVIASGILFGPAGEEIRSDGDILGFFDKLKELYGHDQNRLADIEYWDPRESECYEGEVPVPAIPEFEDYDLGMSTPTHFEAFRVYVPWMDFDSRAAGVPLEFQINGPEAVGGDEFVTLDFSKYLQGDASQGRLASIAGPQTYDTNGWLPVDQALPYTVNFENSTSSSRYVNEVRVITQLDPDVDPHSFELGDIRIGDITIDIPSGRANFQGEFDFAATRGFLLRVSAGVDLYQDPAAVSWLIQAIDPLTGEVLQDTTRGLLKPNDAFGNGAGFVSYTVQARNTDDLTFPDDTPPELIPDGVVKASARVLFDTQAPEDTLVLEQRVDSAAPVTSVTVERIGATQSFNVSWNSVDRLNGSGFKHVTLYVATDGGDFKIWQRQLTVAEGTLVFQGEAGHTYEFLALATDIAGNKELPSAGINAQADGANVNLGALPQVPGTTPPNFGIAPEPVPTPSTNPLFAEAEQGVPNVDPFTRASEFDDVLRPFIAQAFATGIEQSHANIGPMAIAETPDGHILVSGGANRGQIFRFGHDGGDATTPWVSLDDPIFNLAFDSEGRLWATTGGGALLQLDAETGAVVNRFGDGITIALAVEPGSDRLFVSSNNGIEIFDPATGLFTHYSKDENLRAGSLAFDSQGTLWAVTWPDRRQVVKFTEFRRAETVLEFDSDIDSIAFGQAGTSLEDLLFVSHNSGRVTSTGAAGADSELTMVDLATLRRVALATGGSRGDVLITTSDGRLLISQSHQVDVLNPIYAPSVVYTNPPDQAVLPLPLPFISVGFDQDMFAGDASLAESVLNPANYILVGDGVGAVTLQDVHYDSATRSVLLVYGSLLPDTYTLTLDDNLTSVYGQHLLADHVSRFQAVSDLTAYLDVQFGLTRYDRQLGTLSYDVTITNTGDTAVILPALMVLDPRDGYPGIPEGAVVGQGDDGRWYIDLSASLPADGKLLPGQTSAGRTVSVATPDRRRVDFATVIAAGTELNRAPEFVSTPPAQASVGQPFEYHAQASDPDGQAVFYYLLSGPEGMTMDSQTGVVSWAPGATALAREAVLIEAFDTRGAVTLQRFLLDVDQGNRPPVFLAVPTEVEGKEGQAMEFSVVVSDPDHDNLTVWADNLPPGATFDATTRLFSWVPGYDAAGSYPDVRFYAGDGISVTSVAITLLVAEGYQEPTLVKPADRTVREGDPIRFYLNAQGDESVTLTYSSEYLPWGAFLHPETGLFEWTPSFIQEGVYHIPFTVSDGTVSKTVVTTFTVENANGRPQFDPMDGWQIYEGQPLLIKAYAWDPDNPFYEPAFRDAQGNTVPTSQYPQTVSVSASGLPPGAIFDADTWDLVWTPDHTQAGEYFVTFTATDTGDGTGTPLSDTVVVPITVLNVNRPPIIEATGNVSVQKDQVVEVTLRASDPEGNPLVLSISNEQPGYPVPGFISLTDHGDGTATLRLAPGVGDRGDHAIRFTASDDGDGNPDNVQSSSYVFIVSAESDNEPPQLAYLGDVVAVVGQTLQIEVQASDMDQDPLSWGLSGLPAGATITPTAVYGRALVTWTPTLADLGSHTNVTVTVSDSGNHGLTAPMGDSASFRVVVRNANSAPVLIPVGDKAATEGQPLAFQLRGVDSDGDALTYFVQDLPFGARFDRATGQFTWTPALNQAGEHLVTFSVSDGNAKSSETIKITVANTNQLPVFVPMFTQLARENAEISFTVVTADPDADPVIVAATSGLPEGALFVPRSGEFFWTPGYDQAGEHVITFTAADPSGIPVNYDVTIKVANVNRAPVLDESDHTFLIGETKSFYVNAVDPDTGTDLSFSAIDLPEGATLDADTGLFSWTPGPGQSGEYYVILRADDGQVVTRQTIVLRASLVPVPPTVHIELTPSFPALPGQNVLLHAIADSFSDIASLRLYVNGQEVALDANGRATVVAGQPGKMTVRAVAVDADGVTGEQIVQLKVRDPLDKTAPIVALDLDAGARVTEPASIAGQVVDANLDYWRLQIARQGSDDFVTLAEGEAGLDGGLADFDPRHYADGFYVLKLTARDIGGRSSSITRAIEIDTTDKLGQYQRVDGDLHVDLGGASFDLVRLYDSLESGEQGAFGWGWILRGSDIRIETNVASTGREHLGVFNAFDDTTRLYLTLPTGERAGFTFAPVAETIGGVHFYRPAWVADDGHGWQLDSVDTLLTRAGTKFYDASTGQPYNPQSGTFAGYDYRLTAPDGTVYQLDASQGVKEIDTPAGQRLFVSDNGITAESGATMQFVRDGAGRISRVVTPDGTTVTYVYDGAGNLSAVRNLSTGEGYRYAYENGRLSSVVAIGQPGIAIEYAGDGAVRTVPVLDDLGGSAEFTGEVVNGVMNAGQADLYTFSVRASEIAGAVGGQFILRVALTGANIEAPEVPGLTPLSVERYGDTVVALYGFTQEGLYQLRLSGDGAYALSLSIAGDLNLDGGVNGADSALMELAGAGTDITGDGVTDRADRQVLYANFGVVMNVGPQLATTMPDVFTHEELRISVDLSQVATDPDGDPVFYRIISSNHGTTTLSADGRYAIFTPDDGYTGLADFQVSADDGFNSSPVATLAVTVSDAPLLSLDFNHRRLLGEVGSSSLIQVYGDFADQQHVLLPFDYIDVATLDAGVASITQQGLLSALANGYTVLVAARGGVTAATVVGVGEPSEDQVRLFMSKLYGIDAYPDTVTIVPDGGTRQVVVSLSDTGRIFITESANGTLYFSGNQAVATVDANGLIHAVAEGETTVTAIYGYAEETITVQVQAPVTNTGMAVVGEQGGIVANGDGIMVAFGPGQLSGDTTVTIETIAEADLPLPLPSNQETGETTFNFLGAFDLDIQGGEVTGPIQIAVPVAGGYTPGETVWFFQKMLVPTGENGELGEVWTVLDSGTVGEDGVARTASPPFPGLSNRGSVLVARAAQPLGIIRIDMGYVLGIMTAMAGTLGIAATGGLLGAAVGVGLAGLYAGMLVLPVAYQAVNLKIWRQWANNVEGYDLDVHLPAGSPYLNIMAELPAVPTGADFDKPLITDLKTVIQPNGEVTLKVTGLNFVHPVQSPGMSIYDTRVGFVMGDYIKYVDGADYVSANESSGTIEVLVPQTVLLGMSDIIVERQVVDSATGATQWVRSVGTARVDNKGGYGFVGRQNEVGVIDTTRPDEAYAADENGVPISIDPDTGLPVPEPLIKSISLVADGGYVGSVLDTVTTKDLSRVFVATNRGISIIDAFTLQQFDADLSTPGIDSIFISGGVTALALDPSERYLYAAGNGAVYIIDLLPSSPTFHRVSEILNDFDTPDMGRINDIAVNADGTRLFITVPYTSLFGLNGWTSGGRDQGRLVVFNVDERDRPTANQSNSKKWREAIGSFEAGLEPYGLTASSDPNRLLVTSRMDLKKGLRTIEITNNNPLGFAVKMQQINLALNKETVGVRYQGGYDYYPSFTTRMTGQVFDLDIRNATAVVVAPDLSYAFVADWYVPRMYYINDYVLAFEIEDLHNVGSKIGIIKDPFKLQNLPDSGKILGATTPIPMSFLSELALDASGRKLYANFRSIGNVAVYDVEAMEDRANNSSLSYAGPIEWSRLPLDHNWADLASGTSINLAPIDVERYSRGLSLQQINVLNLIRPSGPVDTDDSSSTPLTFEWEVDTDLLGGNPNDIYTTRLVVSSQGPGSGLWPDDDWRERPEDGALSYLGLDFYDDPAHLSEDSDTNPSRIVTSPISLKIGKKYTVTATTTGLKFTEAGDSGNAKRTIVELDALARKALTAGQLYYWGVYLEQSGQDANIYQSGTFTSAPVASSTPYSVVTVLTHGFQLDPISGLINGGQFQQPTAFMQMADMIVKAAGGGVVLSYDKKSGQWVDRSVWDGYGTPPSNALAASVIQSGKAVVLVSDWYVESDISDSGFSEAAADALFASLVDLDNQVGGIFASPLHFIGHSRGTVVNSEIIQRLGASGKVTSGIQMTTLDPHDFDQKSLEIPLAKLAKAVQDIIHVVQAGAVVAGVAVPATAPAAAKLVETLYQYDSKIKWALETADKLGIALDIPYGDFKDPNVQVWKNVDFADNYYQTAAPEPQTSGLSFTATPNGRPLDPEGDPVPGNSSAPVVFKLSETVADIDLNLDTIAGFGFEDFLNFFPWADAGVGGAHSRVWQWYAGTISTSILEFGDMPIWRTAGDEGLATEVFGAIALPNSKYTDQPWYSSNPYRIVGGNNALSYTNITSALLGDIHEGITTGWYFSPLGGGVEYRPDRGAETKEFSFDNTEVNAPADAVPSVFNGDFENGIRQSLYARLTGGDKGRFPFSYELPGWSFHGGEGFTLNTGQVFSVGGISPPNVDLTGLFVFETNPSQLVVDFFKKVWEWTADKVMEMLANKVKFDFLGIPQAPGDGAPQWEKDWYAQNWGNPTSDGNLLLQASTKIYQLVESFISDLAGKTLGGITIDNIKLQDLFAIEGNTVNPIGVNQFKDWMGKAVEALLKGAWNPKSDYALLMGGGQVLKDILFGAVGSFTPFIPAGMEDFTDSVVDFLVDFDTVTHNRLYVPTDKPYLAFEILSPVMLTADAQITVTFNGEGQADGTDPAPITVNLKPGIMKKNTYVVEVPDSLKGKIATLSFTQSKMDGKTAVGWTYQESQDLLASVSSTISQLFFLDDIRFTDSAIQVDVNSPIDENGDANATITLLAPLDATKPTNLVIDWGDGHSQNYTMAAGVNSTSLTHHYDDDNPSGTAQDSYTIDVSSDNTAGGGSKAVVVRNVAPVFTNIQLDKLTLDEGQELTLSADFTDVGLYDSYGIEVDWGDGVGISYTLASVGSAANGAGSFVITHTVADDHPDTGTPQDNLTVTVRLIDDDTGQAVKTFTVLAKNVAPTFTSLTLDNSEIDEGDSVTLTGDFTDPGLMDTFLVEVDWGNGDMKSYDLASVGSFNTSTGVGHFSIDYLFEDDDPDTGTPFDLFQVKVRLVDDDTGAANDTLQLKVNNVDPELTGVTLTPDDLDEGGTVTLEGGFTDPGSDDFTIEVDWGDGNVETFNLDDVGGFSDGSGHFSIDHDYTDDEAAGEDDVYQVSYRVIDDDTGEAGDTGQVTVHNSAPTLENLTLDATDVDEGGTVTLSMDIDDAGVDDELTVEIDWGDGIIETYSLGTGPLHFDAIHTYLDDDPSGTDGDSVGISVVLSDDDGDSVTANTSAHVNNLPPENLDAGPDLNLLTLTTAFLDVFFDDQGILDTHDFEWTVVDPLGFTHTGSAQSFSVFLDEPGVWSASVTVTDDDGGSATTSVSILATASIIDPPQYDPVLPDPFDEGDTVSMDVFLLGSFGGGDYKLKVDWDDGTVQTVAAQAGTNTLTHVYQDDRPGIEPDQYTAKVTLVNSQYTQPFQVYAAHSQIFFVQNVDPAPSFTWQSLGGGQVAFTGSFVDPGSLDTHTITWNWGDGTSDTGSLNATHTFTGPATVTLTVTDDDLGTGTYSEFIANPITGSFDPLPDATEMLVNPQLLALQQAIAAALWQAAGADIVALNSIHLEIADLAGAELATTVLGGHPTVTVDYNAAGHGWYIDANPADSEPFAGIDLITVLAHEFGHVLGLHHPDATLAGDSVMNPYLGAGMRRLPTAADLALDGGGAIATGILAQTGVGIANGGFAVADSAAANFGWTLNGQAGVENGQGVLSEDDLFLSGFEQTFLIPDNALKLSFTLESLALIGNAGGPVDAFEVALLGGDGASLAGVAPMTGTDALLNIQTGGAGYASSLVKVNGVAGLNGSLIDTSGPIQVEIDLTGLAAGTEATLYFDLLGFAARDSRVAIDNVRILTGDGGNLPPEAVDDAATLDEDASAQITILANDSDPEHDALTVSLVDAPQHGTVQLNADGTVTYTPDANYHGADSFTYRVNDGEFDSNLATVSITVDPVNDTPTLASLDDANLTEGQTLVLDVVAGDIDGDSLSYSLDAAPAGALIDASGHLTWTAVDGDADYLFTVRVSDPAGASATRSFTAHVANAAPTLGLTGAAVAHEGQAYTVNLAHSDAGDDSLIEWTIDWGDGSQSTVAGDATQASHVYAGALGAKQITARARDEDGTWNAAPLAIEVLAVPLQVVSFTPDCNGFSVRFNHAFAQGPVNLYGTGNLPGDVLVRGAAVGAIGGSLIMDADGMGFTYLKAGTAFAADSYTVTLKSGANAFTSARGDLDGDADGNAGGDYVTHFSVNPPTQIKLALPDFMRGPGQAVDVPAAAFAGLPVTLMSQGDVSSLSFQIRYDPTLLSITGAHAGSGLPPGATLTVNVSQPGLAVINIESPGNLAAGKLQLVNLVATVPFDAPYQAKQRIDIGAVTINGQLVECADDDALHVVGYLGDTNASQTYELEDVTLIQRMAVLLDNGFTAWDDVSPLMVADINLNTVVSSTDASLVYQEMSGYDRPEIPTIPVRPGTVLGAAASLKVASLAPTDTGFHVRFNKAIDVSLLNLYDAEAYAFGLPDLSLKTASGLSVAGSVVLDADRQGLTFIKTGGVLAAGTYTVALESRSDAFADELGNLLDGNGDGNPGDGYATTFTVAAGGAVLSLGEIARGPGQSVDVPATGSGWPVTLSNAAGAKRIEFTLNYDPALLSVQGVSLGSGVPAGATLVSDLSVSGKIKVVIESATALGAGTAQLIRLMASVPASAPYGAKQVLHFSEVALNGGAMAVKLDDGLHIAAYVGDTSGNAKYSTLDVQRMQRILVRLDTGFGAYPLVDPNVIGDASPGGGVNSLDIRMLMQKMMGMSRPEVPEIPTGIGPLAFSGADPLLSLPTLDGKPGEVVTVPVNLDTAADLESLELHLAYDANSLSLQDVRLAGLTQDFQWLVKDTSQPGLLRIDMSRLTALAGGSGAVLELDFRIADTAQGDLALDLQWAALNETHLTLNPAPLVGMDATDGMIRLPAPPAPVPVLAPAAEEPRVKFDADLFAALFERRDAAGQPAASPQAWLSDWLSGDHDRPKKKNAWRLSLPRG